MDAFNIYERVDRCVCCGDPIPEGRQICPTCAGDLDSPLRNIPYSVKKKAKKDYKRYKKELKKLCRKT